MFHGSHSPSRGLPRIRPVKQAPPTVAAVCSASSAGGQVELFDGGCKWVIVGDDPPRQQQGGRRQPDVKGQCGAAADQLSASSIRPQSNQESRRSRGRSGRVWDSEFSELGPIEADPSVRTFSHSSSAVRPCEHLRVAAIETDRLSKFYGARGIEESRSRRSRERCSASSAPTARGRRRRSGRCSTCSIRRRAVPGSSVSTAAATASRSAPGSATCPATSATAGRHRARGDFAACSAAGRGGTRPGRGAGGAIPCRSRSPAGQLSRGNSQKIGLILRALPPARSC